MHALQDFGPRGLRIVRLLPRHLSSVDELGRALRQHPRVSFAVICAPYEPKSDAANDIKAAMSGMQHVAGIDSCGTALYWPFLYGCAMANVTLYSDMH